MDKMSKKNRGKKISERTSKIKKKKQDKKINKKTNKMKKEKEKKVKNKAHRTYHTGQVFVKIMAGILALLMILSVAGSLVFYLL